IVSVTTPVLLHAVERIHGGPCAAPAGDRARLAREAARGGPRDGSRCAGCGCLTAQQRWRVGPWWAGGAPCPMTCAPVAPAPRFPVEGVDHGQPQGRGGSVERDCGAGP